MSLPNILTLFRIALIPVVLIGMSFESVLMHWIAFGAFVLASITDYFDGKLARALDQTSPFGILFDPVADKLLVCSCLMMLTAKGQLPSLHLIPGIVILCREIFVSGLREFLAQLNVDMPVSAWGKVKTACQLLALGLMILNVDLTFPNTPILNPISYILLWGAATLTIISGWGYLQKSIKHF